MADPSGLLAAPNAELCTTEIRDMNPNDWHCQSGFWDAWATMNFGFGVSWQGSGGTNVGGPGPGRPAPGPSGNPGGNPSPNPGPTPGPNPNPPVKDDCRTYTEKVTKYVQSPTPAGVFGGLATMAKGYGLVGAAVTNVTREEGYSGFKTSLVQPLQRNGVYKHTNFMIGSVMAGNLHLATGLALSDAYDAAWGRTHARRDEAVVELRDDAAGIAAGFEVLRAAVTQNFLRLESELTRILCQ